MLFLTILSWRMWFYLCSYGSAVMGKYFPVVQTWLSLCKYHINI